MDHSVGPGGHADAMSVMQNMVRKAIFALAPSCHRELLRFRVDGSGSYLIIAGLLMPFLAGAVGFGTDATLSYYKHRTMQDAADSAALSAATAYNNGIKDVHAQAKAIASSCGYVDGTKNVTVTVNNPPKTGPI
jgi:Flp pilus assembly protein TadG